MAGADNTKSSEGAWTSFLLTLENPEASGGVLAQCPAPSVPVEKAPESPWGAPASQLHSGPPCIQVPARSSAATGVPRLSAAQKGTGWAGAQGSGAPLPASAVPAGSPRNPGLTPQQEVAAGE